MHHSFPMPQGGDGASLARAGIGREKIASERNTDAGPRSVADAWSDAITRAGAVRSGKLIARNVRLASELTVR